ESLRLAMNHFARDFETEMFQPALVGPPVERFHLEEPGRDLDSATVAQLAGQYQRWMTASRYPALLQDLFLARINGLGRVELFRFDPHSLKLDPVEWPPEFSRFRDFCIAQSSAGTAPTLPFGEIPGLEEVPALTFPFGLPVPVN